MLYERYADKIKRIAAVRDIILRFKFLIIGVLVANFILTVCFLATQGMILGGIKGETEYTYGNDVEFRATALFSLRPSMEYSSDGGETWEKEAPVMPGEYKVRAKTHRMFVIPQRSESVDFVISKKNLVLTLKDNEVEWRAIPSVNTDGLVRGDALSSVEVVVDSTAIGEATADIMESTACITSPDGNDVTGAYNITAEDGTVNVIAKLVTLKANDVTKTYDGTPLAVDGYTVVDGGVIEGHTLDVSFNEPALTNVGSKDIKITGVKIFEGSEDVTEFYRVLTQDGVAKVTKRPVSIVAHDFEKVYDGEALNLTSFTLTDADGDHRLPAGDEWDIRASAKTVESNLTDPQEIIGYVGYAGIKNGEHDVSSNYKITLDNGNVKITKRPITVTPIDETKTYDGKAFSMYSYAPIAEGALVSGDKATVRLTTPALIDAGSENIRVSSVTIKGARGDVTHCYEITKESATAEITPRSIKIIMQNFEKEYDGNTITLTSPTHYTVDGEFVLDHGVVVDFKTPSEYVLACKNKPYDVTWYLTDGGVKNTQINKNYDVTFINTAYVTITSKQIKVNANDITGLVYSATDYDASMFLENQITYEEYLGSQYSFTINFTNKKYRNAGTDDYKLDCQVWMNGVDVSNEFDIDINYTSNGSSKIVIDPYAVTVKLKNVAKIYDGNAVTEAECITVNKTLIGGDRLVIEGFETDCTNVLYKNGAVAAYNLPINHTFSLTSGSVAGNYKVTYEGNEKEVNITINPVKVLISANDYAKMYDGNAAEFKNVNAVKLELNSGAVTYTGKDTYTLVGSDTLTLGFGGNAEYVDVLRSEGKTGYESYHYTVSYKVNSRNTGNYVVSVDYTDDQNRTSDVTIVPVRVKITAMDYEQVYDATYVSIYQPKVTNIAVSTGYSNGEYTFYKEIFWDAASADAVYYYLDSAKNDKINILFGNNAEYINVLRDSDGNVIAYEYTVDYTVTDAKDATVTDKIIDNYDVEIIYTTDSNADLKTDCSLIKIYPISVSVTANNVSRYYDGTSYTITDSGLLTVKVSKNYDFANKKYTSYSTVGLATLDGKQQSYYEIFKYKEDKNDKIAKIAVAFGESQEIKNVKRDADRKVVPYEYTVNWLLYDCIVDNYEVTVSYQEGRNDVLIDTGYYSTITIEPVIVNIKANDYSKIYDDTAVRITDDGVITNVSVQELKIDGSYLTVSKELAVLDGKKQSYYDLVSYVDGKTTVVEKMILHFVDADTGNIVDGYVDVKRDADGGIVAYSYNVIGEMLDGALLSNYELAVSYELLYSSRIYIVPRPVYVTTESKEFDFDGKAHSYPVGKIEAGEDIDGDKILDTGILAHHQKKEADGTWSDYLEMTLVGTKTNTVSFNIIASEGGADKTSNYEIVCVGGTLTVKPLSVSFKASSVKGEYIGKTFDIAVKSYKNVTLFDGDEILFVRAETKQVDAGTGKSYISLAVIKTCYGYEIYTFDGKNATVRTYQRDVENKDMQIVVADGQYIVISASNKVTYYTYNQDKEDIFDENAIWREDIGEESYSYYKFDNVDGKAVVLPREVIILCSSETAEFGPLTGTAIVTKDNMIDGHYLYFVTSGEAVEEGVTVINTVRIEDIQIYSSAEMTPETLLPEYVKDNYKFTIKDGTLLIK
ncbi:MAG: hypothetical protein E7677_02755 [Ruminococcaceae bacterium]|nr:hypothetical protein [Oscillospiraceae bacterium]